MRDLRHAIERLTLTVVLGVLAATAAGEAPAAATLRWRRTSVGIDGDGATALAGDASGTGLAVGDARGVLVGRVTPTNDVGGTAAPASSFERALYRGPVFDLAFTAGGRLLVATDDGLYRLEPDGRRSRLVLGAGAAARTVTRVATLGEFSAAATDDGLFLSRDTESWRRPGAGAPGSEARAVTLQASENGVVCWSIVAGELWRIELGASGGESAASASQRVTLPPGVGDADAVDLAGDLGEAALAVVFPTALAIAKPPDPGSASGAARPAVQLEWSVLRPQLPPGARMRRILRGPDRFWLATDRGLLESVALAGPWRRAAPPIGTEGIAAVVAARGGVFAAAGDGLWVGVPNPSPSNSSAAEAAGAWGTASKEPSIVQVQRVAVHFLGLERSRMEALRRGAARRGWWPIVTLRGGAAWEHGRSIDHDQAFLSGEMRFLTDRDSDRGRDFDVTLTLSWDLRDLAYERESIDVSHEKREVIELRDDILDEITQLYFERRALLVSLQQMGASVTPEARLLRLRADELAAGIDAWTGGWFSSRVPSLAP